MPYFSDQCYNCCRIHLHQICASIFVLWWVNYKRMVCFNSHSMAIGHLLVKLALCMHVGVKSNPIFCFRIPMFPIHYTTCWELSWRIPVDGVSYPVLNYGPNLLIVNAIKIDFGVKTLQSYLSGKWPLRKLITTKTHLLVFWALSYVSQGELCVYFRS